MSRHFCNQTSDPKAKSKQLHFWLLEKVVSNPQNDGTRNGGTTERETAERDFFSVFFFFFFFFFFLNKKKQQQTNSKYISHHKGHAYILYPSRSI